jgi:hypothetical protein
MIVDYMIKPFTGENCTAFRNEILNLQMIKQNDDPAVQQECVGNNNN